MKKLNRNPWDILGVSKDSTYDEVKAAYKKLALEFHPDKHNGNSEMFIAINEAFNKIKSKSHVPIVETKPTQLINLPVTLKQQLTGIKDIVLLKDEYIELNLPAGVQRNEKFKVKGKNEDYIINIVEKIDSVFERYGFSLLMTLHVDIVDAMTGSTYVIAGPDEKEIVVDIPAGMHNNKIIVVPNQGLLNRRTRRRGSLHITAVIDIPCLDTVQKIEKFKTRLDNVRNR
jgi:DnaJ-class molecular chaperone